MDRVERDVSNLVAVQTSAATPDARNQAQVLQAQRQILKELAAQTTQARESNRLLEDVVGGVDELALQADRIAQGIAQQLDVQLRAELIRDRERQAKEIVYRLSLFMGSLSEHQDPVARAYWADAGLTMLREAGFGMRDLSDLGDKAALDKIISDGRAAIALLTEQDHAALTRYQQTVAMASQLRSRRREIEGTNHFDGLRVVAFDKTKLLANESSPPVWRGIEIDDTTADGISAWLTGNWWRFDSNAFMWALTIFVLTYVLFLAFRTLFSPPAARSEGADTTIYVVTFMSSAVAAVGTFLLVKPRPFFLIGNLNRGVLYRTLNIDINNLKAELKDVSAAWQSYLRTRENWRKILPQKIEEELRANQQSNADCKAARAEIRRRVQGEFDQLILELRRVDQAASSFAKQHPDVLAQAPEASA